MRSPFYLEEAHVDETAHWGRFRWHFPNAYCVSCDVRWQHKNFEEKPNCWVCGKIGRIKGQDDAV